MRPPYDSLRFRLMAVGVVGAVLGLIAAGVIISGVFREYLTDQFRRDLEVHVAELTTIIRVEADGRPALTQPLADPRFQAFGTHYWQVERAGYPPARSPSLGGAHLSGAFATGPIVRGGSAMGPKGPVLEYGRTIATNGGAPLRLSLAADTRVLASLVNSSHQMLLLSLAVLGAILIGGGALQLVFGLRPLDRLGRAIAEMRGGGRHPDPETFPSEIRPLVHDLNALLDANAEIVQRARVQAGNLAHGLRTPLAIVMDEADRLERAGQTQAARSLLEQCQRMQKQIDYHMARSRAAGAVRTPGLTTPIQANLAPILSAMERLYARRDVRFEVTTDADLTLAMDPQDFAEIVSSLLDNAGKWAAGRVTVSWIAADGRVLLSIDDDGPGLAPAERERVFAIGARLDDTVSGSGLGLAIARDLAVLYGGGVRLEAAPGGRGLRATADLPA